MDKLKLKQTIAKKLREGSDTQDTEKELKDTVNVVRRTLDVDEPDAKDVVTGMYSDDAEDMNEDEETIEEETTNESVKPRMTKGDLERLIENNL